jgi:serine phosphatase RsbU (regulator of sigma subunit)/putative methionine-R-sulfoxide reductase with GAF domain
VISFEQKDLPDLWKGTPRFFLDSGHYMGGLLDLIRKSNLQNWRNDQLMLVREVSTELIQFRNAETLFPNIVNLIQRTFQFFFVVLYTVDQNSQKIIYRSSAGKQLSPTELLELTHEIGINFGEGLIGLCAKKGEQILSSDVESDPDYRKVTALAETRSEICLPLKIDGEVLGVLEILSRKPNRFHENDILVLGILSDNVALAVQNAGLFDDLLDQTWASTLMLQVAEAAQRFENTDDLLKAVVRVATILTGVQQCAIFIKGRQADDFILTAHAGFMQDEAAALAMLPFKQDIVKSFRKTWENELPVGISMEKDPAFPQTEQFFAAIPMQAHGEDIGVMLVDDSQRRILDKDGSRGDALLAVSRQTALALENFRVKEAQENEAYINSILLQVAEMVASSTSLDETIEDIVSVIPLVVGVDTVFIYMLDDARKRLYLNSNFSSQYRKQMTRLPKSIKHSEHNKVGHILAGSEPCYFDPQDIPIEDWIQELVIKCKTISDFQTRTDPLLMVFPLHAAGVSYGLLFAFESGSGFEYREKKVEIIEGIARHISLTIQNEKLKKETIDQERIQKEMQLAQDIQRTFLPDQLPESPGWKTIPFWQPAKIVGGDFYDVFRIEKNRIGVVIADVSDKGFPAALYMTVARTLIHAEGKLGADPAVTLQRVNEVMIENSREGLFVTCFYSVIDVESGEMIYTNAGHNQPLMYGRQERKLRWLKKGGMPLGVESSLDLGNESIILNKGDQVLFYTDGLVDTQNEFGELFGDKRLFSVMETLKGKSAQVLVDGLESRILDFRGNILPSDDLTMLAIERLA